jgi:hypothetical protein
MSLSGIALLLCALAAELWLVRYLDRRDQRRNLMRHCAEIEERDRRMA